MYTSILSICTQEVAETKGKNIKLKQEIRKKNLFISCVRKEMKREWIESVIIVTNKGRKRVEDNKS